MKNLIIQRNILYKLKRSISNSMVNENEFIDLSEVEKYNESVKKLTQLKKDMIKNSIRGE